MGVLGSPALPREEEEVVTKDETFELVIRTEIGMPLMLMERGKYMQMEERHHSQGWRFDGDYSDRGTLLHPE